jgi:uncharacterized protein YbjT (DUF2867 family)
MRMMRDGTHSPQCSALLYMQATTVPWRSRPTRHRACAGVVISAIGAPESKPFDVSGPKTIDSEGAIKLVEAARDAGVKRFIMVTSLGTTKFGWPASALNLFWGVLYWKAQAEKALIRSGMAYTIIRPGGMERPKDDYKETHAVVLAPRDTYFGSQISRLQVAEVAGACLADIQLSGNKVIEAIADEEADERDLDELLAEIEPEITLQEQAERQAAVADARNCERALEREAEELEAQLAAAEERKADAEEAYTAARAQLQGLKSEVRATVRDTAPAAPVRVGVASANMHDSSSAGSRGAVCRSARAYGFNMTSTLSALCVQSSDDLRVAEQAEGQLEALQAQLDSAKRQEGAAKAVLSAQRTAGRSGEVLSRNDVRDITQPILNPERAEQAARSGGGGGGGGLLGGLFGGTAQAAVDDAVEGVRAVARPGTCLPAAHVVCLPEALAIQCC